MHDYNYRFAEYVSDTGKSVTFDLLLLRLQVIYLIQIGSSKGTERYLFLYNSIKLGISTNERYIKIECVNFIVTFIRLQNQPDG